MKNATTTNIEFNDPDACESMSFTLAKKLADMNFSMFRSLNQLGTSKEKICSVLGLDDESYFFAKRLAGF